MLLLASETGNTVINVLDFSVSMPSIKFCDPPTCPLALDRHHIDIWHIDLMMALSSSLVSVLSSDEKARMQRFKFAKDRHRFALGRIALRKILANYLSISPKALHFYYNDYGKPKVKGLEFNVSHSDHVMLVAVASRVALGIDVEFMRRFIVDDRLAKISFSHQEFVAFQTLPQFDKVIKFFTLWTCKEAFVKAVGSGFSFGLKNFSIDIATKRPHLISVKGDIKASDWWLQTFIPKPHYCAALVSQGKHKKLRFFSLND